MAGSAPLGRLDPALSLPFDEAIDHFRQKVNLPTQAWTDLWEGQHARAFVVAGAQQDSLLSDLRAAVDKALAEGTTLAEFRKDFDRTVAAHGWSYKGARGWRTNVIFQTNLRTAYQAGRYKQMTDPEVAQARPYWEYRHGDSRDPRPEHLAWDGLVLAADDPWWRTHYPPNGWGCTCTVFTLSARDLERLGKTGPDRAPPVAFETRTVGANGPSPRTLQVPKGLDPGWGYNVGEAALRPLVPQELDELAALAGPRGAAPLPPVRAAAAGRQMPAGLAPEAYVDAFLAEFGVPPGGTAIVADVTGERLAVGPDLFRDRSGDWKVQKRGRERWVKLLADTIREPDEIWLAFAERPDGTASLRRRYLARWAVEGAETPALAVFETGPGGWAGVTAFAPDEVRYLEGQRRGLLRYRRGGQAKE